MATTFDSLSRMWTVLILNIFSSQLQDIQSLTCFARFIIVMIDRCGMLHLLDRTAGVKSGTRKTAVWNILIDFDSS
jgi:hypothetical protein